MDKKLPANAGDMGLIPGPERLHRQWSNQVQEPPVLQPVPLELVLCNKRSHQNEKPMRHNEERAPLTN